MKMTTTSKIDTTDWGFGLEELERMIALRVSRTLARAFKEDPPTAFLGTGDDPTEIAVLLPLSPDDYELTVSLDDLVKARLEIDPGAQPALATKLRKLAALVEKHNAAAPPLFHSYCNDCGHITGNYRGRVECSECGSINTHIVGDDAKES